MGQREIVTVDKDGKVISRTFEKPRTSGCTQFLTVTGAFFILAIIVGGIEHPTPNGASGGGDLTADDLSYIGKWRVTKDQYVLAKGLIDDYTIASVCFVEAQARALSAANSRDNGSNGLAWQLIDGHTVLLSSEELEVQNQFGVWSKLHYMCTYDVSSKSLVNVEDADDYFREHLNVLLHMKLI